MNGTEKQISYAKTKVSLNGYTYQIIDGHVQCPYDAFASERYSNFHTLAKKYHRSVINVTTSPHSGIIMFVAS